MIITEIRIRKTFSEGNLKAVVSLTLDNCLAIHDIKVIQTGNKTFVAMPNHKHEDGIYRDIIHPIFPKLRNYFESEILAAYDKFIAFQDVMASEDAKS